MNQTNAIRANMKQISIFVYDLDIGGTEKVMVNLANFLSRNNCVVTFVLVGSNTFLKKELFPGISVVAFKKQRIPSCFLELVKYIRSNRIDCFISNIWPLTIFTILAGLFKRDFLSKVFLIEHCHLGRQFSSYSKIFKLFQNISIFFLYRFSQKVIAVSNGVKDDLCLNKGVNENKLTVLHNPVDISFSNRDYSQNIIKEWKSFSKAKFISVGTLNAQKNYSYLLDALYLLKLQGFEFKHLILGEGPTREALTNKILRLGLEENVYLTGSVDQPINLIKEADTFILSSKFEGFGLVIVEALAAGTTIVSTDCESGPAEILLDGKYGYLAPIDSPNEFAETILHGYSHKIDSGTLIDRAKEYTIEIVGPKYLELISKI
jgi:glycosyltransferase involved in cell wall biosynthesis